MRWYTKTINADGNQLNNLNGLETFEGELRTRHGRDAALMFYFNENQLTDISALGKIGSPDFYRLQLGDNKTLKDITGLESFDIIRILILASCPIETLAPLKNLKYTEMILAYRTNIEGTEGLEGLKNIYSATLDFHSSRGLKSLTGLKNLTRIHELDLNGTSVEVESFAELENLVDARIIGVSSAIWGEVKEVLKNKAIPINAPDWVNNG